ncbi:unnamed protein product [Parajaminaea phylloscopi]
MAESERPRDSSQLRQRSRGEDTETSDAGAATATSSTSQQSTSKRRGDGTTTTSLLLSTLPQWIFILGLIFGGCCSNAYFLELSTAQIPDLGTLITFLHFFFVMLLALPSQIDGQTWSLKKNKVPLSRWAVQVILYASTSLLNNVAFAYDIPMPVHIIFRSGGLVVNMIMGWLVRGKRYSRVQVASVMLVTVGVIVATLSTSPSPKSASSGKSSDATEVSRYFMGIILLLVALILSALMGIWQELTFSKYGRNNWQESIFYSHLLSLPLLTLRGKDLRREWDMARNSTPASYPLLGGVSLPSMYPLLALNVLTQLACINGVNRLTSRVSSVGVTLVLVVRKAVSLALSVLLVGGSRGADVKLLVLGATAVFAGTIGYARAGSQFQTKAVPAKSESKRDQDQVTTSREK